MNNYTDQHARMKKLDEQFYSDYYYTDEEIYNLYAEKTGKANLNPDKIMEMAEYLGLKMEEKSRKYLKH